MRKVIATVLLTAAFATGASVIVAAVSEAAKAHDFKTANAMLKAYKAFSVA